MLSVDHVSKTFQQTSIINDITFDVKKGEIVTIVGPSGGGKTTLLRCLNRLIETDKGKICFESKNITQYPPSQLRKKMILVPQESIMFPGTVKQNIALALNIHQIYDEQRIKNSLTDVGLKISFLSKKAQNLSGGEKKRVSLARALALSPKMLLLDEPTAGIDPKNIEKVEQRILTFCTHRHLTVLWVTHDVAQAKRVSNRIANIKQGRIIEITTPDQFHWEEAY